MELDKRIIEGKKPLTCFDIEEAREFEGKEGYFCDYPRAFAYGDAPLEKCATMGILELDVDRDYSICPYINKTTCLNYPYFLPAAWIKPEEPEKKYRAFTLAEWLDQHEIGEVIHYRSKSEGIELRQMYMGYAFGKDKDITKANVGSVTLGVASYSFDYLFDYYEIEIDGKWQSFGVIEDD